MSSILEIMRISYPLFEFKAKAIRLTTAAIIMVVLLAANVTITNAQQQEQQQQLSTSQPATTSSVTQNGTTTTRTLFESTTDSFRVQLPEGWVIQDMNNTGFTLAAEVLQGYGILAQLCPQEQQQSSLPSVGGSNRYIGNCQQAQEEVIHIIRYPNLGTRLGISSDDIFTIINRDTIPNAILAYHIQKLQEVGYRDIQIVNSADTTMNVDISTGQNSSRTATAVPAKLVEMTYRPSPGLVDMRSYSILATIPENPQPGLRQIVSGESVTYEGPAAATPSGIPPPPVQQIFQSLEFIR